jgi:transaldolase
VQDRANGPTLPINVTLLFSREHYLASADAYMRGLERRIAAGFSPDVRSVASVFESMGRRNDGQSPRPATGQARHRHRPANLQGLPRYSGLGSMAAFGARPQRLLFASTGTKDPKASHVLYIAALAAPNTIDTIPEKTLLAFADPGKLAGVLRRDGGDCETVLDNFRKAGIDLDQLAADLQSQGAKSFDESWQNLLGAVESKGKGLQHAS